MYHAEDSRVYGDHHRGHDNHCCKGQPVLDQEEDGRRTLRLGEMQMDRLVVVARSLPGQMEARARMV